MTLQASPRSGISVAVQGGGMRSSYSMGALAELEQHPLSQRVTRLFGTSGGSLNLAYFVCGQSRAGVEDFSGVLCTRRFIDPRRFWKVVDVDFLVREVMEAYRTPNLKERLRGGPELQCGLTRWPDGASVWTSLGAMDDPFLALTASAAIPVYYSRRIRIADGRYVDGGIADPFPVFRALSSDCGLCIAIATRPATEFRPRESAMTRTVLTAWPRLGRGVRSLLIDSNPLNDATSALLAGSSDGEFRSLPLVLVVPSDPSILVDRLCTDSRRVAACAEMGAADMRRCLSEIDGRGILRPSADA